MTEKAAEGAVGVFYLVFLQFFNVLGIDGGDDEFDFDGSDRELYPPSSPEDVLVRFEGQLIKIRCVIFYCTVDFAGLREVAVCKGAAGCAGEGSVRVSEW